MKMDWKTGPVSTEWQQGFDGKLLREKNSKRVAIEDYILKRVLRNADVIVEAVSL
jgi:hypothetical protein